MTTRVMLDDDAMKVVLLEERTELLIELLPVVEEAAGDSFYLAKARKRYREIAKFIREMAE